MKNIEHYIEKVKEYVNNNPNITEDELVRYVYLDLGKRLSFNLLFIPFGNSRGKSEIYKEVHNLNKVDECLATNTVICNTASKILELVLRYFDVNIQTVVDEREKVTFHHTYNIIKPKDGRREYSVDLQEDMYHIQMNDRTPNYGIDTIKGERVISYYEQEQIDKKLGYINNERYYTDDYLYTLKMYVSYMDTTYKKLKHILENIEVYENPNMGYTDRQWYHVRILEYFFNYKEFNYQDGAGKIRIINCYKKRNDNTIIYVNGVVCEDKSGTHIFLYNRHKCGYVEIKIDNFVQAITHGLVLQKVKICEVQKRLKMIRDSDRLD